MHTVATAKKTMPVGPSTYRAMSQSCHRHTVRDQEVVGQLLFPSATNLVLYIVHGPWLLAAWPCPFDLVWELSAAPKDGFPRSVPKHVPGQGIYHYQNGSNHPNKGPIRQLHGAQYDSGGSQPIGPASGKPN